MNFKKRFTLWLLSVIIAGCSGVLAGSKLNHGAEEGSSVVIATVDGRPIRNDDAKKVYSALIGRVVGEIILTRVIAQHFYPLGLKTQDKDIVWPAGLHAKAEYEAFGFRLYSEERLRLTIMHDWPKTRLKQVYALFEKELAQYDLTVLEILRSEEVPSVIEDLARDIDFGSIAARYGSDESGLTHQFRRWYSITEVEEDFGPRIRDIVLQLEPGLSSKPVRVGSKDYLFSLHAVSKSFAKVQPLLVQRALNARRKAVLYELLQPVKFTFSESLGADPDEIDYQL